MKLHINTAAGSIAAALVLSLPCFSQSVWEPQSNQFEWQPGFTPPSAVTAVVPIRMTRHGVPDVAFLGDGKVWLLSAPDIHREYHLLYGGSPVHSIAVIEGPAGPGEDRIVAATDAGLVRISVSVVDGVEVQVETISAAPQVLGARQVVVGDFDDGTALDLAVRAASGNAVHVLLGEQQGAVSNTLAFPAPLTDLATIDWPGASAEAVAVVGNWGGYIVHPTTGANLIPPYPFTPGIIASAAERVRTQFGDRLAIAVSGATGVSSLFAIRPEALSPTGFVPTASFPIRPNSLIRELCSGVSTSSTVSGEPHDDLIVAYASDPSPDLFLNMARDGITAVFGLDPEYARQVDLGPMPPASTTCYAFVDLHGDRDAELMYSAAAGGALASGQDAVENWPHAWPEIVLWSYGYGGSQVDVTLHLRVRDNGVLQPPPQATHAEILLWEIPQDEPVLHERVPVVRETVAIPATGDEADLIFAVDTSTLADRALFVAFRWVEVDAEEQVVHAYESAHHLLVRDDWSVPPSGWSAAYVAAIIAMEPGTSPPLSGGDPAGGIPLIIPPIVGPPEPVGLPPPPVGVGG